MNWNGQRPYLDHLIKTGADPDRAPALQAELDAYRRKRIQDALLTRPVFIPLEFSMTAAGSVSPYRDITPALNYDVIVTGFKTDCWIGTGRDITISFAEGDASALTRVGENITLYLRTDDLMGSSVDAGGGQIGTFYLPAPIRVRAGNRMIVEMFKTDTTAATEEVNIVLTGVRVLPRAYAETAITEREKAIIDRQIEIYPTPQPRFLKVPVTYSAATAGVTELNVSTPRVEEPLLVRGIRTTLRQSMIQIGLEGEAQWTVEECPIWGVAAENDLGNDNYIWFSKPLYLPAHGRIMIPQLYNSIDGTNVDGTDASITFICETV